MVKTDCKSIFQKRKLTVTKSLLDLRDHLGPSSENFLQNGAIFDQKWWLYNNQLLIWPQHWDQVDHWKLKNCFSWKIGHFDKFIPVKIAPLTMTDRFHTVLILKWPIYILWIFGLFLTEILSKVIITCVDKHFFGYILTKKDVLSSKFIPLNLNSIANELRHWINRLRNRFHFCFASLASLFFKSLAAQRIKPTYRTLNHHNFPEGFTN